MMKNLSMQKLKRSYFLDEKENIKDNIITFFLPYIIIIFIALSCAISGYNVYQLDGIPDSMMVDYEYVNTIYGIEAFLQIYNGFIMLCSNFVPILPVILIYQIVYIIVFIVKKSKRKEIL